MTKRATFSQADLERALRAAKAVGYAHPTVDIRPDGTIRLLTGEQEGGVALNDDEDWVSLAGAKAHIGRA